MLQLLPRHDFGNLQSRVIPAMFQFGNLCMGLAVLTFLHQHPLTSLSGQDFKQVCKDSLPRMCVCVRARVHALSLIVGSFNCMAFGVELIGYPNSKKQTLHQT